MLENKQTSDEELTKKYDALKKYIEREKTLTSKERNIRDSALRYLLNHPAILDELYNKYEKDINAFLKEENKKKNEKTETKEEEITF